MENTKMDLYENYFNRAKKYLCEDEDDLDIDEIPDEDTGDEGDMQPCPDCGGEGEIDGDTCETCGGTGEVPVEGEEGDEGEEDGEEVLELDLSNPVCPSCGASLIPVGAIDTTEEDEDGNPIYDDDEADAIDLLQGRGYVIYKPAADDADVEGVDDDFPGEDDEDFDDEDLDDEETEDEE